MNCVVPSFIKVKINAFSRAAQKAKNEAEKIWLKSEIKFKYGNIVTINHELYSLKSQNFEIFIFLEKKILSFFFEYA
jgi:hypothetical protein